MNSIKFPSTQEQCESNCSPLITAQNKIPSFSQAIPKSIPVPNSAQHRVGPVRCQMSVQGSKEIEIASCSPDGTNAVFILHGEDHTLGNALRGVIAQK